MNEKERIFSGEYVGEDKIEEKVVGYKKQTEVSYDLKIDTDKYAISKPRRIITRAKVASDKS